MTEMALVVMHEPVLDIKEIEFLVSSLDQRERELIFREFEEELAKTMSRTALMKLRRGEIHLSNDRIIELMMANEKAKEFVLELVRKKAERLLAIVEKLEKVEIPKELFEGEEE